jgi:hypothetical protein
LDAILTQKLSLGGLLFMYENLTVDSSFSGNFTISGSGVAIQGPNINTSGEGFYIKSDHYNCGIVYIYNHGGDWTNGYTLANGEELFLTVENLNSLDFNINFEGAPCIVRWCKK